MEEEQDLSQDYIKGFNDGYILSKYEPELTKKILSSKQSESEYSNGMKAGDRQQRKETLIEEQEQILKKSQQHTKGK